MSIRRRFGGLGLGMGLGGGGGRITQVIIDLLTATCTRATTRTVWGLPIEGVGVDGSSLLTIGTNEPAITGGRYLNPGWSSKDTNGRTDGNEVFKSPFCQTAALGDSFTAVGRYLLQAQEDDQYAVIRNNGVGGDTTTDMLARLQSDILDHFSDVVIVQGGINDIIGAGADPNATMQSNITDIITDTQTDGRDIVLINISAFGNHADWNADRQTWTETYNTWLSNYATTNSIPLVNIYELLRDGIDLSAAYDSGDGLHPNVAGHNVMGTELASIAATTFANNVYSPQSLTTLLSVEYEAENIVLQSNDPDNGVWAQRGTFDAVQDLVGADGEADTGWTFSGIDSSGVGDLLQTITGLTLATRYEPLLILKQIDAVGEINFRNTLGTGRWIIDFSLLSTDFEVVDRNHPAVFIFTEFDTVASTSIQLQLYKQTGTGTLSVGFSGIQLEEGIISSSYIPTTTIPVTRNVDICTSTTPNILDADWAFEVEFDPSDTGQTGTVYASYTDADNYIEVSTTATTVVLRKRVGGTNYDAAFTYTHTAGTMARTQCYGGTTGTGIRVADSSADITAETFQTNADTTDTVWGSDINWGHLNGTLSFIAEYYNVNSPTGYDNKNTAGW